MHTQFLHPRVHVGARRPVQRHSAGDTCQECRCKFQHHEPDPNLNADWSTVLKAVNRSGLMLLKVYGNEDENRNSEGAVEHLEWCGDCEHWEVVKEAPRLFRRRSV